ncbi:MAG: hypothetical protein AAGC62_02130 [Pseudomonadota bacterium]
MPRSPRFVTFDPEQLRLALGDMADPLGEQPIIRRALMGRPLDRAQQAWLKKKLLRAWLPDEVDHRSGAYAKAKREIRLLLHRASRPTA